MASIKFTCTSCGKKLRIRDFDKFEEDARARKGKCPSCGAAVMILSAEPDRQMTAVGLASMRRWMVMCALAGLLGGAASGGLLLAVLSSSANGQPDVVKAHRFEVTGADGRAVATLASEQDRVLLRLCDQSGAPRAELFVVDSNTGMRLLDGQETILAQLAVGKLGSMFALKDASGTSRLSAAVNQGTSGLSLHDRTGQSRLDMIFSDYPDGIAGGNITIHDRAGTVVWEQPVTTVQ